VIFFVPFLDFTPLICFRISIFLYFWDISKKSNIKFQELPILVLKTQKLFVMKKIEAIVRKTKFEEVRAALHDADIDFLSWWDVRGQGTARQGLIFRGIAYDVNSVARVYISFVVRDQNVEKSIDAILDSAYTGESGDGRIFITDINESIRIRTKDRGDESLYNK
jgi:nitrogen regulatory protein P-II 1